MTHAGSLADLSAAPAAQQRFLDAALDLFGEHGFEGTSLQLIADRLEVTKAALYYHFRTKDDLLAALVGPAFTDLERFLDEVESIGRETTRRKRALEGYVDYLIRHRRIATWLAGDVAVLANESVWGPAQTLGLRLNALLTFHDDSDPVALVWSAAITQSLTGALTATADMPDEWVRSQLEEIGELLMRGYRAARRRD
ncbi:MAG: helix-turn-helix domain-containing protein [Marmoricola sp.]